MYLEVVANISSPGTFHDLGYVPFIPGHFTSIPRWIENVQGRVEMSTAWVRNVLEIITVSGMIEMSWGR